MSVAKSYAKALYEAAGSGPAVQVELDKLEAQMDRFLSLLKASKDFRIALFSPITSAKEKAAVIEEMSKKMEASPLFAQFLGLLAKKGRLSLFEEIREAFGTVRLTQEGGLFGQLVTAEPMVDSDIDSLAKAFSHKLGKKVAFRVSTDPLLLAGMKVTVNGVTYDGTLRSQLQKLRDRFVAGYTGQA